MAYPDAAWERAMTVQEVMMKALSGELHWFRAADILGWSPRTLRRWRERYETHGYVGLVDKRRQTPVGASDRGARGRAGRCGCIASSTRASMCGTFTKSRDASTASRCPTAS